MTVYRNKKTSRGLINRSSTALTQDLTTLTASFQEVYSLSKMEAFQETLTARKANRLNPVEHYPLLPALKKGEKIVATLLLMTPLRLQVLEDFFCRQGLFACAMHME